MLTLIVLGDGLAGVGSVCFWETMRYMSPRMFVKASSTLVESRADVSIKDRPFSSTPNDYDEMLHKISP